MQPQQRSCRLHCRSPLRTPARCRRNGGCSSPSYFGRDIKGRALLTNAEWAEFAAQIITPNFPDGFTVFDAEGQWQNPQTGHIMGGPTKILLVAAKQEPDFEQRISAVIDAYKTRFHQQSIGVVTHDACAAF